MMVRHDIESLIRSLSYAEDQKPLPVFPMTVLTMLRRLYQAGHENVWLSIEEYLEIEQYL